MSGGVNIFDSFSAWSFTKICGWRTENEKEMGTVEKVFKIIVSEAGFLVLVPLSLIEALARMSLSLVAKAFDFVASNKWIHKNVYIPLAMGTAFSFMSLVMSGTMLIDNFTNKKKIKADTEKAAKVVAKLGESMNWFIEANISTTFKSCSCS